MLLSAKPLYLILKLLYRFTLKLLTRSLQLLDLLLLASLCLLDQELELRNLSFASELDLLSYLSLTDSPLLLILDRFLRYSGFVSEFLHFFLSLLLIDFAALDLRLHLIDELLKFVLFLFESLLLAL